MAKKKSARKKTKVRKTITKSKKLSGDKKSATTKPAPLTKKSLKRKTNLAVREIILFGVLFIISLLLYNVSTNEVYLNLFWLIALLSGFVVIAFVIAYVVLYILNITKK